MVLRLHLMTYRENNLFGPIGPMRADTMQKILVFFLSVDVQFMENRMLRIPYHVFLLLAKVFGVDDVNRIYSAWANTQNRSRCIEFPFRNTHKNQRQSHLGLARFMRMPCLYFIISWYRIAAALLLLLPPLNESRWFCKEMAMRATLILFALSDA